MLLMTASLIWSFLLLVSTNDIRKKHGLVNSETPRYCLIYLDLIYLQTIVHSAVQKKNGIEKLAFAMYSFLFYFVLDKTMLDMAASMPPCCWLWKLLYLELKTLLTEKGICVQGQDRYLFRTSDDQRGE